MKTRNVKVLTGHWYQKGLRAEFFFIQLHRIKCSIGFAHASATHARLLVCWKIQQRNTTSKKTGCKYLI